MFFRKGVINCARHTFHYLMNCDIENNIFSCQSFFMIIFWKSQIQFYLLSFILANQPFFKAWNKLFGTKL